MDIYHKIGYTMGHETPRNTSTVGNAKTKGHCIIESGQDILVRSSNGELIREFCSALVPEFSQEWAKGTSAQASAWSTTSIVEVAETKAAAVVGAGTFSGWLSNRLMDIEAHCRTDRKAFRREISSQPCMEVDGGF